MYVQIITAMSRSIPIVQIKTDLSRTKLIYPYYLRPGQNQYDQIKIDLSKSCRDQFRSIYIITDLLMSFHVRIIIQHFMLMLILIQYFMLISYAIFLSFFILILIKYFQVNAFYFLSIRNDNKKYLDE